MSHQKSPNFAELARRLRRVMSGLGRPTPLVQPGPGGSAFTGCTIETRRGPHKIYLITGSAGTVSVSFTVDPQTAWRLTNAYEAILSTEQN